MIIHCRDGHIKAHQAILHIIPWFKAALDFNGKRTNGEGKETNEEPEMIEINLREYSTAAVSAIKNYAYAAESVQEISAQHVQEILVLAAMFELPKLQDDCEDFLIKEFSEFENMDSLNIFLNANISPKLRQHAAQYLINNQLNREVIDYISTLKKEDIFNIFLRDNICITENTLLMFLFNWARMTTKFDEEALFLLCPPISETQPFCLLDCIKFNSDDFKFFNTRLLSPTLFHHAYEPYRGKPIASELYGKTRGFSWQIYQNPQSTNRARLEFDIPVEILHRHTDFSSPMFSLTSSKSGSIKVQYHLKWSKEKQGYTCFWEQISGEMKRISGTATFRTPTKKFRNGGWPFMHACEISLREGWRLEDIKAASSQNMFSFKLDLEFQTW